MKTMQRFLALALCLALVCALLPQVSLSVQAATYSGTCGGEGNGGNLTWKFDSDTGLLIIEGSGAMENYSFSYVPWYQHLHTIKKVLIKDGVTSIGTYAFDDCSSMTSVTIPDSVTSIGNSAFQCCSSLTSVTIPDKVTSISESMFLLCDALTSVTLGNKVTSIDDDAFSCCRSLTKLTIPNSVTSIGDAAFYDCSSLTSMAIPDGVTSIKSNTFHGCSSMRSVTIPGSVTSIGCYAFFECSALDSVTIPNGVTVIDSSVFSDCSRLKRVTIPDSVTSIGDYAFRNCASLVSITIPDSVESILWNAFDNCTSLTSITIPDGVTTIYDYVLSGCGALTSVTIPDSVTSINDNAFRACTALANITIPDSVTSIGSEAFYNCTRLTCVTIPTSVTSIGDHALGFQWDNEAYDSVPINGFTICGYNNTAAQTYAKENGIHFASLDNAVGGFADVKPKDWYADAVLWAVESGITGGVKEHHFGPKQNCTREQVVTFLWATEGSPEPGSDNNPFKDVKKSSWFRKSVLWAVEQGITGGVDQTHFGVGQACDRAQVVMFLWAAAGRPEPETAENKFTDVKKKDYFYSAVLWAVENGITAGSTPTTFSPKTICSRAQVVTFLYAAYADK